MYDRHLRHDAKRRRTQPWRAWYKTREWRDASRAFLADPANRYCVCGCGRRADVVDHVQAHRGDPALFWSPGNWQPMAWHCHSSAKQRAERLGYGTDIDVSTGLPTDPRHPFFN
jgi:5-methylcytosine-specific restriction endonuclease McrA